MVRPSVLSSVLFLTSGTAAFAPVPSTPTTLHRHSTVASKLLNTRFRMSASPLEVVDETTTNTDESNNPFDTYSTTEDQTTVATRDTKLGTGYTIGGDKDTQQQQQLLQVKFSARILNSKFTSKIKEFDVPNMVFSTGQGRILPGLEEGMRGMKVGGKRLVRVPPNRGYGDNWYRGVIPPNSHLEFEVELLNIAQTPGEEFMMKLEQFGVGRAIGAAACLGYLALSPLLEKSGVFGQ